MKLKLAIGLIIAAALTRLLPHPLNFTPIGAMGLFAAAYFGRNWLMLAVPVLALLVSDLLLNNLIYSQLQTGFVWFSSGINYLAFALITLLGFFILKNGVSPLRVVGSSLAASALFFLLTNFTSWLSDPIYAKTFPGLLSSYAAGIPFFGNTVMGDLFYSAVLFGTFEFVSRKNFAVLR